MVGTANRNDEALDVVNGVKRFALPRWAQNVLGFLVGTLLVALVTLGLGDHERLVILGESVVVMKEDIVEVKARQQVCAETYQRLLREFLELKSDVRAHGMKEEK